MAILTGAGDVFCAGADLKDGAGSTGTFAGTFWEKPTDQLVRERPGDLFKPTIAAVNGPCIGYGLTGVLFCDFVIAAERATLRLPRGGDRGTDDRRGASDFPSGVGWANAMELLLIGEPVDAERAAEMGLVWRVVPGENLADEAMTLARRLCQGGPLAVRATKEMAARGAQLPWSDTVRMGETMRRVVAATDDASEGLTAAAERRRPDWTGT